MLKQKTIKLPENIRAHFLLLNNQRFIVFRNIEGKVSMAINIPSCINFTKEGKLLVLAKNYSISTTKENSFYIYLKNFVINFQIPTKKIIVLRGLGLKANLEDNSLNLKLGYSHESTIRVNHSDRNQIFVTKKFISVSNYNKLFIGNFVEKIYRLKKANCYKGRGLYLREKKIIIKTVKKS